MIRIAICDDEKNIRTYLSSLVRKQNIECEITEYASTDEHLSDQKEHEDRKSTRLNSSHANEYRMPSSA